MDTRGANDGGMVCLYPEPAGKKETELWSLVLQAVGVTHELNQVGVSCDILISPDDVMFAQGEIAAFESENVAWPPVKTSPQPLGKDDISPFLLMAAMMVFFSVTGPWREQSVWFTAGAVSSEKILGAGEWWRLVTGLTLHADASHLLGNVFLGGVFLYLLAQEFGGGTAALVALFSGSVGNWLNLIFRHESHLSVGFSTSVFGMVGAFCISRWFRTGAFARQLLIFLGVAFGLLALLGSGGERTDFGAHLWGMAVGLIAGGICSLPFVVRQAKSTLIQVIELLIFVVMICISWYRALSY